MIVKEYKEDEKKESPIIEGIEAPIQILP